MKNIRKWLCSKRGQTLVEYALILALVAIVAIVVLSTLGDQINNVFTDVTNQLTNI